MRIAFIHDWPVHFEQAYTWRDGLCAAIRELKRRHTVEFWVCGTTETTIPHPYFPIHVTPDPARDAARFEPDVILMWGDCTRPNASHCSKLGIPMALCFAGGDPAGPTSRFFDHFFVESRCYFDAFRQMGASVSIAFGTNTELFQPIPNQAKIMDVIFPATFAGWKRHPLFAQSVRGLKSCAVGYIPQQEYFYAENCRDEGILVLPHLSAEALRSLYAGSRTCVVTSHWSGGSQRTVLEALAMNIPLVVMADSDRTSEYVRDSGHGMIVDPDPRAIRDAIDKLLNIEVQSREYILDNWSEFKYAQSLEKGLSEICRKSAS